MTQPDEATMAPGPEKAHGDALADAADASTETAGEQHDDEADADRDG